MKPLGLLGVKFRLLRNAIGALSPARQFAFDEVGTYGLLAMVSNFLPSVLLQNQLATKGP
jgi:hypothetical protein